MLLRGAHAGVAARVLGTGTGAAAAAASRDSSARERDADVADVVGRGAAGGGRGRRGAAAQQRTAEGSSGSDEGGGGGGAPPPAPAPPPPSRVVLNYDPMAGARPDNRGFQRRAEEAQREEMRAQHEAAEAQRKQAAEAARCVKGVGLRRVMFLVGNVPLHDPTLPLFRVLLPLPPDVSGLHARLRDRAFSLQTLKLQLQRAEERPRGVVVGAVLGIEPVGCIGTAILLYTSIWVISCCQKIPSQLVRIWPTA
jgi:hypothetical protein